MDVGWGPRVSVVLVVVGSLLLPVGMDSWLTIHNTISDELDPFITPLNELLWLPFPLSYRCLRGRASLPLTGPPLLPLSTHTTDD